MLQTCVTFWNAPCCGSERKLKTHRVVKIFLSEGMLGLIGLSPTKGISVGI